MLFNSYPFTWNLYGIVIHSPAIIHPVTKKRKNIIVIKLNLQVTRFV